MGVNNWVKRERKANSIVQCCLFSFTEKDKLFFSFPILIPIEFFISQSNENEKWVLQCIADKFRHLTVSFSVSHKP